MKVIRAPAPLLASSASLFVFVPVAVVTAGVFSSHVWWDLPMGDLALAGWVALSLVAPISWRLAMGRRGAWEALASLCVLLCLFLLFRAAWMRGTLQGLWAVAVSAICGAVLVWTRIEQNRSYFQPRLSWFQGLPVAIPRLSAKVLGADSVVRELRLCRFDSRGCFGFARDGTIVPHTEVELHLSHGDLHEERRARITGTVVRQFEGRLSKGLGRDWGVGIRFHPPSPDAEKEFRDFLEVLRGEGYIDE